MGLRESLIQMHQLLTSAGIDHALIGGLALACHGVNRATADVDFLIDGNDSDKLKKLLKNNRKIFFESAEVLQFEGSPPFDFLLANRPLSKQMLNEAQTLPPFHIKCLNTEDLIGLKIQAYCNDPKREHQDKADIQQLLIENPKVDFLKIKKYADLFNQWPEIEILKKAAGHEL